MRSLQPRDCSSVLELVAKALRCASPDFPDAAVTGLLRDLFHAEFASAGIADIHGTASRTWADSPRRIPVNPGDFHKHAISHLMTQAYRRTGELTPLRLSDVPRTPAISPEYGDSSMAHLLTIPLAVTSQHICAITLLRSRADFTSRDLQLACQLQPVLGGIYVLRDRLTPDRPDLCATGTGIPITLRELAVLDLMADGLITAAIARRLGISPHTVSRHIESIYRKFGTHDRTSAVLRGQALGYLRRKAEPAGAVVDDRGRVPSASDRDAQILPTGEARS
jgi:DNA-binding CsgD family transcriptional regulator